MRTCLREPVPEIALAAKLLSRAVDAHLAGDAELTRRLVRESDIPAIREWTESLWGRNSPYAPKAALSGGPMNQKTGSRMPLFKVQAQLHLRDGYHCRFCGIPVIRKQVRERFRKLYPELAMWGRRNSEQHAAFQAMWVQYDHIVPYSRGGDNHLNNLVVTCAPCNYGRMECTLEEASLIDPRTRDPIRSNWDGLERFR